MDKTWKGRFAAIWLPHQVSQLALAVLSTAVTFRGLNAYGVAPFVSASLIVSAVSFALAPLLGILVDRLGRRAMLLLTNGVLLLAVGSLFWLDRQGALGMASIVGFLALAASLGVSRHAAIHASVTMLVPRKRLLTIAGLGVILGAISSFVGPRTIPIGIPPISTVAMAALACEMVFLLAFRIPEPLEHAEKARASALALLLRGVRAVFEHRGIALLLISSALFSVLGGITATVRPAWVLQGLGHDSAFLGAAQFVQILAGLLGGLLLLGAWWKRKAPLYSIAYALTGAAIAASSWLPYGSSSPLIVVLLIIGLMPAIGGGLLVVLLQTTIPPDVQGRVFALFSALGILASWLGNHFGAQAGILLGVRGVQTVAGCILLVLGAVLLMLPVIWKLENPGSLRDSDPLSSDA